MLRIPLPEDDGFALAATRKGQGFLRVLDVVEVLVVLVFPTPSLVV